LPRERLESESAATSIREIGQGEGASQGAAMPYETTR
jgi:hypothetical protein